MIKASGSSENLSVKFGIAFAHLGISPNAWTMISLIPAALGFFALVYNELLMAALLFLVSGFIDAIDGAVARVTGFVTNLGAFLDGIIDRYVEFLLYFGLLIFLTANSVPELFLPHTYWIVLLVFGAVMPTFVRAYADHRGVVTEPEDHRRMGGLIERAERLILILAGMIGGWYYSLTFLVFIIAAVAVLSNLTALQRIAFVVRK